MDRRCAANRAVRDSHTKSDTYCDSDCCGYRDAYCHSYSDRERDGYSYAYCYSYCDSNSYCYAATNAHTQVSTDAEDSSHSAAQALIFKGGSASPKTMAVVAGVPPANSSHCSRHDCHYRK